MTDIDIPSEIDMGLSEEDDKIKTSIVIKSKDYEKSNAKNFTPEPPKKKTNAIVITQSNGRRKHKKSSPLF